MRILWRLSKSLQPYRWQLIALVLLVLAVTATLLVTPSLIQAAIDDGLNKHSPAELFRVAVIIIAVGLARALFGLARRYLSEWLVNRTGYDFRNMMYDKIQRLSFSYHDQAQTGNLMTRCTEDISALSRFIGQGAFDLISVFLLFVGIVMLLLQASPTLALIGLGPMLVLAIIAYNLGRIQPPLWYKVDQAIGDLSSRLQENLSGAQVVRAFAREEHEKEKFKSKNRDYYKASVKVVSNWGFYMPTMNLFVMLSTALILWFGGQMAIAGTLTIGELVAFNAYLLLLAQPVQDFGFFINAAGEAIAGGQRIYEVLDLQEEIKSPPHASMAPTLTGRVTFDQVSFSYRGDRDQLSGVSFEALPNQVIALIGPTGSGKTSLVNLIPRFYDVTSGQICVDDLDIRSLDLKSLRSQIGIVLQTALLFSSSIRDNIAYGRLEASQDEVIAAAKAARAHEFIQSFTKGYETVVGERGVTLSGGQRQRLAIARALLMNPRILILDDSTSSVDTETEYLIQQALAELMQNRTTFVIAQRLSTVKRADQIIVLEAGRIVQRGKHDDLLEQGGLYKQIYDLQLKDQEQFAREMLFLDRAEEIVAPDGNGHATLKEREAEEAEEEKSEV